MQRVKFKWMVMLSLLMASLAFGANVNVTTKYGKTGGIIGGINHTTDKVNGREICPADPTAGCDFDDDPKWNNNNTVDNPSDDYYTGDLLVRTNDNFQAIAGWTWNGTPSVGEDEVTITGTLPVTMPGNKQYYEWTQLPGTCDLATSSISADKQTIICVRKGFDGGGTGTKSEDLTFNVRVKGGTPDGATPGDITFKIEAQNATAVTDTTDNNSLTVTAAPRWNLEKSAYTILAGQEFDIDGDGTPEKGWIMDYKFYIESDEITRHGGEIENVNPIVGNESMGDDATFTFKDDMSGMPPNATLIECSMNGRYTNRDGYVGSADPVTCFGTGCILGSNYPERHILAAKGAQVITCAQTGDQIDVTVEHVDATLDHYPTKDYYGRDLSVKRAIAAIGSIYVFIPLENVRNGANGVDDGCQQGTAGCDDGQFTTHNEVTEFDPTTPTGNSNFGGLTESEKDNYYNATLYYASGSFDKYFRGGFATKPTPNQHANYISSTYRSGDGMVTTGAEFSTWLTSTNRGGTSFSEASACDVIDAYRYKVQAVQDNREYTRIKTVYVGKPEWPYRMSIYGDDGDFTDSNGADSLPFIVEYATGYVDDSFLPSKGGDTAVTHTAEVLTECTDASVVWTEDFDSVKDANGGLGVTKIRYRLKPGVEYPSGGTMYLLINHEARVTDLATNQPLLQNDLLVNYVANKYNYYNNWAGPSYIPGTYPGNPSGTRGDRYIITGPKVRIKKLESRTTASPGVEVTYKLQTSYTDDIGSAGGSGQVTVTDVLPKDFNYIQGSTTPFDEFGDPAIGTCADVLDINVTPCVDGENQVLIWDYGMRPVNAPGIPDLNYTVLIGASAKVGVNTNVVKIDSPTDASPLTQRKADIGLTIDVPASINIVKSTEENPAYPSKRERTTDPKDIFFLMDMRNGKNGAITDLDVIDILPFVGDSVDGSIKFNDLELKRNTATAFHGTMMFHEASFTEHPGSSTDCDTRANGGVKYYYTNEDPTSINMAPTVGDANNITHADSIWCEGDENGPNGCTIVSSGFTFTDNAQVTAVRARGPRMEAQAICQFRVHVSVNNNLMSDNYSNSAGASATGITLPVLSNSVATPIVGSSLGDYVWYDQNKDGMQNGGESGIAGVTVHLLDDAGNPVNDPTTGQPYIVTTDPDGKYGFTNLNHGNYKVTFDLPEGYAVSPKGAGGDSTIDSDATKDVGETATTETIALGVAENNPHVDLGLNTPVISGHIFDDGDGDGNVNGNPINKPDGEQLYATLLANDGTVLATTPIADDGTYSFDGEDGVRANADYKVVLSTEQNATVTKLPGDTWNNTGEKENNANNGDDGTKDGIVTVHVGTDDVPNNDFGINKKPEAVDMNKPSEINPGGDTQVGVPALEKKDREDGDVLPDKIKITEVPTNATLYYDGNPVTAGQVIDNYDPSKLTLDPDNGDLTATFKYTVFDNDGQESDPATVTMPFTDLKISGHVFDDGNGDGNINGTPISDPDGTQLHATLVDANGNVLATTPIAADGNYSFGTAEGVAANTDFTVVLGTTAGTVGQPAPAADLPANWNNADGEKSSNDQNNGNDGQVDGAGDGQMTVSVGTVNVPNNDFGINHKPIANDETKPSVLNPGGNTQVTVPPLDYSDDEDGKPSMITIKTLPDPATGVLYYNGTPVTAGQEIPNFDPALLTVDPTDGDQTVVFTYTTTDAAGVESEPATVTMPFTGVTLSGHVFDDGNGDGNINGTPINKPDGTQLYATLLDADGNVVATTPIADDGTYTFTGAQGVTANTEYSIVLATTGNATDSDLPANWNNADGEQPDNPGNGNDGQVNGAGDGKMTLTTGNTTTNPNNDFGINHKPVANDETKPIVLNPGGNTQVTVPPLDYADDEDGTPSTITIKTLPNNATLYYDGQPVVAGTPIPNFDPSKLTVDPIDGDQTVVFTYTTTDAAGVESDPATVTLPFTGLGISGTLFDDGNGDGNVNGDPINKPDGQQLYVNLVDANGNVIATKPLADDGTYQFLGADGVTANTDYTIVLSTTEGTPGDPAPAPDLPANWNNTGENINSAGAGDDGAADGVIAVSLGTTGIPQIDFGINHKPVAEDKTEPAQSNPSGDTQYPVPALPVTDTEDGTPTTITIKTLPDPATGVLYYDGVPVTAGQVIPNFDPSKLTVDPTDGNQVMVFTYTTTDAAGIESDPATVTLPFLGEMHLGDTVWMDDNGNGAQDPGEKGVAGVKVTLLDEQGNVVATTTTDADGKYEFIVTEPGKYQVQFDDAYYYTKACDVCTEDKDSNVHGHNNTTGLIEMDWGDNNMTVDAGVTPTAHIGDYFWIDADADGIQDADEQGVANAKVELLDENGDPVLDQDGNPMVVYTDENGKYGFDVPAGVKYLVRFNIPQDKLDEGYVFTSVDAGEDGVDSDVGNNGVLTVPVDAQAGANVLTLDAGINCGCADVASDGGDALTMASLLAMMFLTLSAGLLFVRREEQQA